jgi:hypothetical protein
MLERVSDIPPFGDQRDKKYNNRDKLKRWDEFREHLICTGMSVGCYQVWNGTSILVAINRHNTHAVYKLLFV